MCVYVYVYVYLCVCVYACIERDHSGVRWLRDAPRAGFPPIHLEVKGSKNKEVPG
jgi:hypothetical protein